MSKQKSFLKRDKECDGDVKANCRDRESFYYDRCEALCAAGFSSLFSGDLTSARLFFIQALELEIDCIFAYMGLAKVIFPGDGYIEIFKKILTLHKPKKYVEIGVEKGTVLNLFDHSVQVIGVDPEPQIDVVPENVSLYKNASDDFFLKHDLEALLGGSFDLAFIDGLHLFEQVLRDFIHLEKSSSSDAIILIHDCLPLDRRTSERERSTIFWTGDVWKIVPCLKQERPDLSIFTIPAYPAGLCVVTGLNRESRILAETYDTVVQKYCKLDFGEIEERENYFSLIDNDWATIKQKLKI